MNLKMNKKVINEMEIIAGLESIRECTEVARKYINDEIDVNDIKELVVALASVDEEIGEIKKLINEIINEYESEIMEFRYE